MYMHTSEFAVESNVWNDIYKKYHSNLSSIGFTILYKIHIDSRCSTSAKYVSTYILHTEVFLPPLFFTLSLSRSLSHALSVVFYGYVL